MVSAPEVLSCPAPVNSLFLVRAQSTTWESDKRFLQRQSPCIPTPSRSRTQFLSPTPSQGHYSLPCSLITDELPVTMFRQLLLRITWLRVIHYPFFGFSMLR